MADVPKSAQELPAQELPATLSVVASMDSMDVVWAIE
jgi:hypothetical protein